MARMILKKGANPKKVRRQLRQMGLDILRKNRDGSYTVRKMKGMEINLAGLTEQLN